MQILAAVLCSGLSLRPELTGRRVVLQRAFSTLAGLGVAPAIADEPMRTSASFNSLQDLTGEVSQNLGAGTIAGKSRPVTGVVLVDEVAASGPDKAPTISAEIVLNGGVIGTASFQSAWPVARGMYYDVESRSKDGDSAFVTVAQLPAGSGSDLGSVPASVFTSAIFSAANRFGAYGAPTDIRVLKSKAAPSGQRILEVEFSALSPGLSEIPRRAIIAAIKPEGSNDVVMLVAGSTASRWKRGAEEGARVAIDSFRVSNVRATKLRRARSSDYRFEDQGGLWGKDTDVTEVF